MRAAVWMIASAVLVTACAPALPVQRRESSSTLTVRVYGPGLPGPSALGADGAATTGDAGAVAIPPAPEPISPFDDTPTIFTVAGQHFTRGERVIVTVCLSPDRTIASAGIFESSGDSRFDALAITWARRVRLRAAAQGEQIATCGTVRVEVRPAQEPRVFHAPSDSLS